MVRWTASGVERRTETDDVGRGGVLSRPTTGSRPEGPYLVGLISITVLCVRRAWVRVLIPPAGIVSENRAGATRLDAETGLSREAVDGPRCPFGGRPGWLCG